MSNINPADLTFMDATTSATGGKNPTAHPNLELDHDMTFRELRDHLNRMDESSLDLPVYVYTGDNVRVKSITLFDSEAAHTQDNPLAFDLPEEP